MPAPSNDIPLVPCRCNFKCGVLFYADPTTHETRPGQLIKPSTRTKHRKRDQQSGFCEDLDDIQRPLSGVYDIQQPSLITPKPSRSSRMSTSGVGVAAVQVGLGLALAELEREGKAVSGNEEAEAEHAETTEALTELGSALRASVSALGSWLYLVAGLSRASVGHTLSAVRSIVAMAIKFGELSARFKSQWSDFDELKAALPLPRDVRTAMKTLSIEPKLSRTVCCPKCFKQYRLDQIPERCTFRATRRSRVCGELLFTTRSTRAGPLVVPRRLYNVQNFQSWLEYFLCIPGIEEEIDKSYAYRPNRESMGSVWDSPAWQSLGSFTTTHGNLAFSYFIDWFNPFTNKIAGKTVSAGAIMFFCLNLPSELQYRPEYTYFAAITPLPKEPDMETITAVSDPVISQLERMWSGQTVRTCHHPEGVTRRVAVLPAIGDLLAMRKALGFAGVGSLAHFCSFCYLHKKDIESTDITSFTPRNGTDVRAWAELWRTATTKKERNRIFKLHGVRWSSMNTLTYRDPVKHTVLGVMHNWIEGVLQHHVRFRWGIGRDLEKKQSNEDDVGDRESVIGAGVDSNTDVEMEFVGEGDSDCDSDVDMNDINEEIIDLHNECQAAQSNPSKVSPLQSEPSSWLFDITLCNEMDDEDYDPQDEMADLDDSVEVDDDDITEYPSVATFTDSQLAEIQTCIGSAVIPSYIERPPSNLGEKTHGKLKADQWLKLFIVFLPLILPEIWTSSNTDHSQALLKNFYSLVTCTNIVCAYTISNDYADLYLSHYIKYRKSALLLFPHAPSRPNHHYAMHNTELMKFWGPLIRLSEFPYEQHNGTLQKVKTNGHIWEMDLTMLRQICRRSRIKTLLQREHKSVPRDVVTALLGTSLNQAVSPKLHRLSDHQYDTWLAHLNSSNGSKHRHRNEFPHPEGASILSPWVVPHTYIEYKTRTYSVNNMHPGNSSISFCLPDKSINVGFILSMWSQEALSETSTTVYLLVSPHLRLSLRDARHNPYVDFPGLKADIVYAQRAAENKHLIIEASSIIGHVPFYARPKGTFGIKKPTLVIVDSLHRNL